MVKRVARRKPTPLRFRKSTISLGLGEADYLVGRFVSTEWRTDALSLVSYVLEDMRRLVEMGVEERQLQQLLASLCIPTSKSSPAKDRRKRYTEYIKSDKWKRLRERIFSIRGRACEQCGFTRNLSLHHLNYERVGCERDEDLKILCNRCHCKTHGRKIYRKKRAAARKTSPRARNKKPR